MGWQEELRQLDVDLANGTIDHDRHRKLRDELLAGASGGSSPSPVASPLRRRGGQQPVWQSTNPGSAEQRPAEPKPPRQQQPTKPQPAPPAPPKQPKPVKPAPFETDRRTTAPSPADERPTDFLPYPKPNPPRRETSTVVRPAVLPPPPPPRPEPVFVARTPEPARPLDLDSYEPPEDRQRPVWLFVALGVVLVAALIAGGMWALSSRNKGDVVAAPPSPSSSAPSTSSQAASAPKPVDIPALPKLPGTQNPANTTSLTVAKGLELGLYSQADADTFTRNGVTQLAFNGSAEGPRGYLVLVVPTSGPPAAKTLVDYLYKNAIDTGFTPVKSDQQAAAGSDGKTRWDATWYTSGDKVVSVGLSQPMAADKFILKTRHDQTVKALLKVLPPG
jgi:hypothetical protein